MNYLCTDCLFRNSFFTDFIEFVYIFIVMHNMFIFIKVWIDFISKRQKDFYSDKYDIVFGVEFVSHIYSTNTLTVLLLYLPLRRQILSSCSNDLVNFHCKSIDWFLYNENIGWTWVEPLTFQFRFYLHKGTAWKVSKYGVFLVCIFLFSDYIQQTG